MLKRLALVMAAIFLMTAAAQGQTAADIRAGVAEVVVSETELFGELYLQAEAFPSYNVADGSLGVTLTSQENLARCTYRNPGPDLRRRTYQHTSGGANRTVLEGHGSHWTALRRSQLRSGAYRWNAGSALKKQSRA